MNLSGASLAQFLHPFRLGLALCVLPLLPAVVLAIPPQFRPVPDTDNGYERTLLQMAYLRYLERVGSAAHARPTCSPDIADPQYTTGIGADNELRTYRIDRPTSVCPHSHSRKGHVPHFGSNR